ncbi:uncharacterized protein LOC131879149 isoform X1 [Tigriopus californicus]|uniref:uncharacterized protein LOC131879149 isoform X1 n=1 Tax=Tigriopus californicus TaxID=6832 RepID=UPI0027D9DAEE|nr:uncharacterized protein LOC131879149 isoform X1 [Tigriopus californicus]
MLIEPREVIRGNPSEPYALRTLLGWICRGKTDPRIELGLETESRVNHAMVEVPLNEAVSQFYHTESYGAEGKEVEGPSFSIQDQYALKLIKEGTKRLESQTGYEVSLPWIPGEAKPWNNRSQALKRLEGLERKFLRDPKFQEAYVKAMGKTIHEGYARLVPSSELSMEEQGFLPHHGVWKKNGSDVRVVFDSASKYRGKCLNDCLLTGPNLQNELFDVLVRFREHEIALTADIEAMFSRIRVKKEDAAYHRFLWRESSSEEVQVWEMTGVVFGDSCSPCIAINVLHQTVEDAGCEEEIQESK